MITAALPQPSPEAIHFVVPGVPVSKGRPRFTIIKPKGREPFVSTYTPPETRKAEADFATCAKQTRPRQAFAGAVRLRLLFVFPVPESWPQRRRAEALAGRVPHTTKPDADNLLKLVKDALNGIFWQDDKQIVEVEMRKRYGPAPCTVVDVEEIAATYTPGPTAADLTGPLFAPKREEEPF